MSKSEKKGKGTISKKGVLSHEKVELRQQGRIFTEIAEGRILFYYSQDGDPTKRLNGLVNDKNGKPIVCRQLAYFVAKRNAENYHAALSSIKNIAKNPELFNNEHDNQQAMQRSRHYEVLPLSAFAEQLRKIAVSLAPGQQVSQILNISNHNMSITVRHSKSGAYMVKFYDPNQTNAHKNALCGDLDALNKLTLLNFLSHESLADYAQNSRACCFLSIEQRGLGESSQFIIHKDTPLKEQLFYALMFNRTELCSEICRMMLANKQHNPSIIEEQLAAIIADTPGFFMALQYCHPATVSAYITAILSSDLSEEKKCELLAAKIADGTLGFFMALQKGHAATVSAYITAILNSDLSEEKKCELLAAKLADGKLGLFIALQQGHAATVSAYISAILSSDLSEEKKCELLATKKTSGTPGLFIALQQGHAAAVSAYIAGILSSNLSEEKKCELLAAKIADDTPGLFIALQKGQTAAVSAYITGILNSSLTEKKQSELLAAISPHGASGLLCAMSQSHVDTVIAYVRILSNSMKNQPYKQGGIFKHNQIGELVEKKLKNIKSYRDLKTMVAALDNNTNSKFIQNIWSSFLSACQNGGAIEVKLMMKIVAKADPFSTEKKHVLPRQENELLLHVLNRTLDKIKTFSQERKASIAKMLLQLSVKMNHIDATIKLLSANIPMDLNQSDSEKFTPLTRACSNKNIEITELLLSSKKVNLNQLDSYGGTALIAIFQSENKPRNNDLKLAKLLLKFGADPMLVNNKGETALMYAARYGLSKEAQLLLQHGKNSEHVSNNGWSALMFAYQHNQTNLIKLLLRARSTASTPPSLPTYPNYFETLGLDVFATTEEIKASYLKLSQLYGGESKQNESHPNNMHYGLITQAHKKLQDEKIRATVFSHYAPLKEAFYLEVKSTDPRHKIKTKSTESTRIPLNVKGRGHIRSSGLFGTENKQSTFFIDTVKKCSQSKNNQIVTKIMEILGTSDGPGMLDLLEKFGIKASEIKMTDSALTFSNCLGKNFELFQKQAAKISTVGRTFPVTYVSNQVNINLQAMRPMYSCRF